MQEVKGAESPFAAAMTSLTLKEARLLLHNKFVVVLGDSIQRTVYKDLVLFLQTGNCLTNTQLRSKGELTFEGDQLVEGGRLRELGNGTDYREVRQHRSPFHLLRFYFLTRVYSSYVESILGDFQAGPQPDVLIVNSCVWDISRYGSSPTSQYTENLRKLFSRLNEVLLPECLVIWNMAMPLGEKLRGGFLIPELQYLDSTLRGDVIEANFYSAVLANDHGFDVLDLHYHFRFELKHRAQDGIHWNKVVHRSITNMLLAHIAEAWGVTLSPKTVQAPLCLDLMPRGRPVAASGVCVPFCHRGTPESHNSNTVETDFIRDFTETRFGAPCPGYTSFHINPTSNTDPAPYRADLAPPQADRRYRGPAWTGGSSDGYWGLRSNDLVMRWRLHRWIPAPYSRLPHDRLGHY